MSDHIELLQRLEDRTARRCWLLYKSLECLPLDRALDLARTAEAFVSGFPAENRIADELVRSELPVPQPPTGDEKPHNAAPVSPPVLEHSASRKRTGFNLSQEQREQLLERLARGATNTELASLFGLSSRQVQGVRMGSARELAKRRDLLGKPGTPPDHTPVVPASAEDVVRYLRQRDDVVVRQANGDFLVNARFQLPLADLVTRANRMRSRQGKPAFQLAAS